MGCRFAKTTFLQLVGAAFSKEGVGELDDLKKKLQENELFKAEFIKQAELLRDDDLLKVQMLEFVNA